MGVIARILCRSAQDSHDFQLTAQNYGIRWSMPEIEMPWNLDRPYLMISEGQPDKFYLSWATLEDFARENVPLIRAGDFAWDPNTWPRTLQAYRHRQVEAIKSKVPTTVPVAPATNVIMPEEFVATKYPGYFWNVKTKQLFTAKLGVLRQLKVSLPNKWNRLNGPAYRISHEGVRRTMTVAQLSKLTPKASVFPVEFVTTKSNTNDDVAVNLSQLPAGTTVRVRIEG